MKHLTKLVIAGVAMSLCMGVASAKISKISRDLKPGVSPSVAIANSAAGVCNAMLAVMPRWYAGIELSVQNFEIRGSYVAEGRTVSALEAELKGSLSEEADNGTCQSAATVTANVKTIAISEGKKFGPTDDVIHLTSVVGDGCAYKGFDGFTLLFTLLDNETDKKKLGASVGVHAAFPNLTEMDAKEVIKRLEKKGCRSTYVRGITYGPTP